MICFFELYPRYMSAIEAEMTAPRPSIDRVRNIRRDYKQVVGSVFRAYILRNGYGDIVSQNNIACWCSIAGGSTLFSEATHMLECIMGEMLIDDATAMGLRFRKRTKSKSDLQTIIRLSRMEAKTVQKLYNRVAHLDHNFNGDREYVKIRKALLFLKTAIGICMFSKLPTTLTMDEHSCLIALSGRPDIVQERYRFNTATGEFNRVGGLQRKSAYKLFGIAGCTVFIERAVHRYEIMLGALGH